MSILIKGMEMPTSCVECHNKEICFTVNELAYCPWCREAIDPKKYTLRNARHPNCPLVPVPPHGRLGDLDALFKQVLMHRSESCEYFEELEE